MRFVYLTLIVFLTLILVVSIAQEEEIDTGEVEDEIPICGDGKCTGFEDETICPKDCNTEDEIIEDEPAKEPTTVEEPSGTPKAQTTPEETEQKETTVEEKGEEKEEIKEESSFFSSWIFLIAIVSLVFIGGAGAAYFIYKKKTSTEPQKGIIEEQKTEETKTTAEEKAVNPKLIEYIKTNIAKGFTKEQIKTELLQAKWDEKEIDEALAKF